MLNNSIVRKTMAVWLCLSMAAALPAQLVHAEGEAEALAPCTARVSVVDAKTGDFIPGVQCEVDYFNTLMGDSKRVISADAPVTCELDRLYEYPLAEASLDRIVLPDGYRVVGQEAVIDEENRSAELTLRVEQSDMLDPWSVKITVLDADTGELFRGDYNADIIGSVDSPDGAAGAILAAGFNTAVANPAILVDIPNASRGKWQYSVMFYGHHYYQDDERSQAHFNFSDGETEEIVIYLKNEFTVRDTWGDVNYDGSFTLTDLIAVQRWLLNDGTELRCWEAADFDRNWILDGFDLARMKRDLVTEKE